MRAIRSVALILLAGAGCVSSRSAGFIDDDPATPPHYFKSAPRVWARDREITVEVRQTPGPSKVASIGHRVEDGNVYLWPYTISGGRGETSLLTVDLRGETLPDDWRDRVYWIVGEHYYPIGHPAFWDSSLREPARRKMIELSPPPDE